MALLQLGDPSLSVELTRLADLGAERITLVAVSLGTLGPAVSWLRRIAAHWWRERPGPRPLVEVGTALVKQPDEVRAVLGKLSSVNGTEAGLESAAWEDVPERRHQVLIFRGPRCTALGSDRTAEAVILELMRLGQGDDDVLITHTGCQFPCNHAPVVNVQPDDVWYGEVDPDAARRIASEHLVAGRTRRGESAATRPAPGSVRSTPGCRRRDLDGGLLVSTLDSTPASAAPIDAIAVALEAAAGLLQERRDFARQRHAVIAANAGLQERELSKLASLWWREPDTCGRSVRPFEGPLRRTSSGDLATLVQGFLHSQASTQVAAS